MGGWWWLPLGEISCKEVLHQKPPCDWFCYLLIGVVVVSKTCLQPLANYMNKCTKNQNQRPLTFKVKIALYKSTCFKRCIFCSEGLHFWIDSSQFHNSKMSSLQTSLCLLCKLWLTLPSLLVAQATTRFSDSSRNRNNWHPCSWAVKKTTEGASTGLTAIYLIAIKKFFQSKVGNKCVTNLHF